MTFRLRGYQDEIIAEVRAHIARGTTRILIQSPTGSGKTALTAFMLGSASQKGHRCWFTVHRRELIKQSASTFGMVGIRHGVVAAGFAQDPRPLVQIAGIQTLARRFHRLAPPKIIVWDEAHHVAAASWSVVHNSFPRSIHIGLTATPERLDGRGLGNWFDVMVRGPNVAELIEAGYLSPYRLFAPPPPQALESVHTRAGDFLSKEASAVMRGRTVIGDALGHYRKHAGGKRAVVFCCDIEHSRAVVTAFNAAGIPAAHVDGETPAEERDGAILGFQAGHLKILSNVELFGEGFDLPAIECAILLRPTYSTALYLQQVGRALRICEGKTQAVILDHAGNSYRHGLPDEERDWTLADRERQTKGKAEGPAVQVCPQCLSAIRRDAETCNYCGFPLPRRERAAVTEVAGELAEVDVIAMRRAAKREQAAAATLEELTELARKRKYRNPDGWARHIIKARQDRLERINAQPKDIIGGQPWPREAVQK